MVIAYTWSRSAELAGISGSREMKKWEEAWYLFFAGPGASVRFWGGSAGFGSPIMGATLNPLRGRHASSFDLPHIELFLEILTVS